MGLSESPRSDNIPKIDKGTIRFPKIKTGLPDLLPGFTGGDKGAFSKA